MRHNTNMTFTIWYINLIYSIIIKFRAKLLQITHLIIFFSSFYNFYFFIYFFFFWGGGGGGLVASTVLFHPSIHPFIFTSYSKNIIILRAMTCLCCFEDYLIVRHVIIIIIGYFIAVAQTTCMRVVSLPMLTISKRTPVIKAMG